MQDSPKDICEYNTTILGIFFATRSIFYHTYRAKGHIFELHFYNALKEDTNTLVVHIYRLQNVGHPYYDLYHEARLYCTS